ncbi:MAG: HAMP domain-containing histidine kinase [Bacteroidetes bacterium]|nr:HAMP domain-containing histidine kinase [Bacteroidota bacterium]
MIDTPFMDATEATELTDAQLERSHLSMLNAMMTALIHDINNPLAGILGYSQYLVRKSDIPADILDPLRDIYAESVRLNQVIASFSQLCRRDEGRVIFFLGSAINDVLRFHRKTFAQLGVHLEEAIADHVELVSRRNLIQQTASHILTHVAKSLPEDATAFTVSVEVADEPTSFSISVKGPLERRLVEIAYLEINRALMFNLEVTFEQIRRVENEELFRVTMNSRDLDDRV